MSRLESFGPSRIWRVALGIMLCGLSMCGTVMDLVPAGAHAAGDAEPEMKSGAVRLPHS